MNFIWVVFTLLIAAAQLGLVSQYPAYQYWDMDHTTMIDLLLLRSYIMPDHMAHPGFGLYFLLNWAYEVMSWLYLVSVDNIQDFKSALNPILVASEMTLNLRYFMSILNLTTASLFALSLINIFRTNALNSLILFITFTTQVWIAIHSPIVRTEPAALFFIGLSLYSLSFISAQQSRRNMTLIFTASFFAGVAIITKIQAVGYLIALPFICQMIMRTRKAVFVTVDMTSEKKQLRALFIGFIALMIVLFIFKMPENIENFRHHMRQPSSLALLIIFVLSALVYINKRSRLREYPFLIQYLPALNFLPVIIAGVFLSLLAPLLTTSNLYFNLEYTLSIAKTLLYGKIIPHVLSDTKVTFAVLFDRITTFWPWFILNLSLLFLCIVKFKTAKDEFRKTYAHFIALFSISLIIFIFLVRNIWRQDIVWYEPLLLWIAFSCAFILKTSFIPRILIGAVFVFQLIHFLGYQKYTTYSDREEERLFKQVYGNHQAQYTSIIDEKLQIQNLLVRTYAAKQARQLQDIKNKFTHVLVNQNVDLKSVFSLVPGMPADVTNNQYFVATVSNELVGVHVLQIEKQKTTLVRRFLNTFKLGYLHETLTDENQVSLRFLRDVRLLLFIESKSSEQFKKLNPEFVPLGQVFTAQDNLKAHSFDFEAYAVPAKDVKLDLSLLSEKIYLAYQDKISITN